MNECEICGLNHRALGVELINRVLYREARASVHFLRLLDGSIAFSAKLWDAHLGEIDQVQCLDLDSGVCYHANWKEFASHGSRRILDLRFGEQVILPLRFWKRIDTRTGPGDGVTSQDAAAATNQRSDVAEQLTSDLPRPVWGLNFNRPRRRR